MLHALKQRRENDEQGFTLIELMVVVLIIAILLAIAIPTFLGAQNRAKDRAAQSDLRNAVTAAKTLATDQEGYFRTNTTTAINKDNLFAAESSLSFVAGTGTVDAVGVTVTDAADGAVGGNILLTKKSKSSDGFYWGIKATHTGIVEYCKGEADGNPALTVANCDSESFANAPLEP